MPTADRGCFGDAVDFRQSLPADTSSRSGEFLTPRVSESERLFFGKLFAQVGDFGTQVGDLGDEFLVLLREQRGSDESYEEGQAVHGAAESARRWWSYNSVASGRRQGS